MKAASPRRSSCIKPVGIRDAGGLRTTPSQLPDIMATVLDVTGAAYPKVFDGHDILPCEGESLVPSFGSTSTVRGTAVLGA